MPLDLDNVAWLPATVLFKVNSLPDVPAAVKLDTVCVVPAVNVIVVAPVGP